MKLTMRRSATTALALGLAPLALVAPSAAAPGDHFVVDTQFYAGQSRIAHATGSFVGCRLVKNLSGEVTTTGFRGSKRVICGAGAMVVLEYAVTATPTSTSGTWWVVSSSLAGVDVGDGGTLTGTQAGCTPQRYSGGCILDTFTQTS